MVRIALHQTLCKICVRWTGQGKTCLVQDAMQKKYDSVNYLCWVCHWNEKQTTEKFRKYFYSPAYACTTWTDQSYVCAGCLFPETTGTCSRSVLLGQITSDPSRLMAGVPMYSVLLNTYSVISCLFYPKVS